MNGSHAAKALSRAGHRVVVYDSLVAGHRAAVKYGTFVEGDVLDGQWRVEQVSDAGVRLTWLPGSLPQTIVFKAVP